MFNRDNQEAQSLETIGGMQREWQSQMRQEARQAGELRKGGQRAYPNQAPASLAFVGVVLVALWLAQTVAAAGGGGGGGFIQVMM